VIYRVYGNTYAIKEELKTYNCKWDGSRACWVTPIIEKNTEKFKRIQSIIDAVDGIMVPVELSEEAKKIQGILHGNN